MANKEINIFSVSFLDLLSGALAAVLILFIVVPKMSQTEKDAIEELEKLHVQQEQLSELIEQARNSISMELYEQIQQQLNTMQNTISELSEKVGNLQEALVAAENENQRLREQIQETTQQSASDKQKIKELEEKIRQLQKKRDGLPSNLADRGEVEIFILWAENVDVDLYVQNLSNGETCQHPSYQGSVSNVKTWGMLGEDINNQRLGADGSKYYEIFYQPKPVSGQYKIYYNIYDHQRAPWSGRPATVSGFAVIFPGKPNEKRIDFETTTLTRAMENHVVGVLEVTENDIRLQ